MRKRRWSPRWIAASASTIVNELISSTNDVTDVNGMFSRSCGVGPPRYCGSRPRYRKYVAMNAPKKSASDDRNSQIASFGLLTPVFVGGCPEPPVGGVRDDVAGSARALDGLRHQCAPCTAGTSVSSSVGGSIAHALRPKNRNAAPIPASHQNLNTKP